MVVMVVEGDLGAIEVTHSPGGGDHQGQGTITAPNYSHQKIIMHIILLLKPYKQPDILGDLGSSQKLYGQFDNL